MSSKPKIINKNNQMLVRIQTTKGEQLSAREADALSRDLIQSLFPVKVTLKGKQHQFVFDVAGYMPLPNYLKSGLRKQHFAALLSDAFYTLKDLQNRFFSITSILLSHQFVFIHPVTKKVRFVFVPIQLYDGGVSIREFYLGIAKLTTFSQGENTDYVDEYLSILSHGINVSMFELEEFIQRISADSKTTTAKKRCRKCSALNNKDLQFCSSCGAKMDDRESKATAAYDPFQSVAAVPLSIPDKAPVQYEAASQPVSASVAVAEAPTKAWLIQKRTNKKYEINKPVFHIGKSEDSDILIPDNPVISRNHAEIRGRDGHFFAVDLFSTNKTFVNGQQLQAQKETELLPGNIIRLGNEEFEFQA